MRVAALLLVAALQTGCAQYMAFREAEPLDRSVVKPGIDRTFIVAKLGAPTASNEDPYGLLIDTYAYEDGGKRNQIGWKFARVLLYTAGDIFTLFLTQLVFMPAELLIGDNDYTSTVEYEPGAQNSWVSARITETKLDGKKQVTVQERPGFTEERAKAVAARAEAAAVEAARLAAETHTGTCFAISPGGLLITADHVLGTADRVAVDLADGRSLEARVERRDPSVDAALLRLEDPTPKFLSLASAPLAIDQPVFTLAGATAPAPAQLSEGVIVALQGPQGEVSFARAKIEAPSDGSGGPMLDERGEVVGLVAAPNFSAVQPASSAASPSGVWATRAGSLATFVGEVAHLEPAQNRDAAIARAREALCRVRAADTIVETNASQVSPSP